MKVFLLFTGFLILSFQYPAKLVLAVELRGVVVDSNTGLPVSNVYVYVKSGEEEVLTNKKGEFKFVSWQALPVSLTAQHKEYQEAKLSITDASRPILIKLKVK